MPPSARGRSHRNGAARDGCVGCTSPLGAGRSRAPAARNSRCSRCPASRSKPWSQTLTRPGARSWTPPVFWPRRLRRHPRRRVRRSEMHYAGLEGNVARSSSPTRCRPTDSASSLRATKPSTWTVAPSSHWASSIRHTNGRWLAASASKPNTANSTRNRPGTLPLASPKLTSARAAGAAAARAGRPARDRTTGAARRTARHHRHVPAQHDPSPCPSDPSTRSHGRRRGETASPNGWVVAASLHREAPITACGRRAARHLCRSGGSAAAASRRQRAHHRAGDS